MNHDRRPIWSEPRPPGATPRSSLDWFLVGALETTAILEAVFRPHLVWRPFAYLVAAALIPLLLWRRSHPLRCAVLGWGSALALSVIQLVSGLGDIGLYSMAMILVLLYALVRWGSGREVMLGLALVVVSVGAGMWASFTVWADVFGGSVFVFAFVAMAAVFRSRADVWHRQIDEVRNQERVELARELHDTVAHHVSAIAIQAQAGRAVAAARPETAAATLAVIEREASRTLEEMRAMVRVLREGEAAEYTPQAGIADLPALARTDRTPTVTVSVSGELAGLPRAVDAAVYRLARESLTNATRHARDATRIDISVCREGDRVRLHVADDGRTDPARPVAAGFGLLGMTERAQLLGGSLLAGPRPSGGWTVDAVLPVGARP